MQVHGFQLRIARHAVDLTTRAVREALGVSLTTLARIEGTLGPLPIGQTMRQEGTREPQLIAALVRHYEALGVTFVPASAGKPPGVLFDEARISLASGKSPAAASPRRAARNAAVRAASKLRGNRRA